MLKLPWHFWILQNARGNLQVVSRIWYESEKKSHTIGVQKYGSAFLPRNAGCLWKPKIIAILKGTSNFSYLWYKEMQKIDGLCAGIYII